MKKTIIGLMSVFLASLFTMESVTASTGAGGGDTMYSLYAIGIAILAALIYLIYLQRKNVKS